MSTAVRHRRGARGLTPLALALQLAVLGCGQEIDSQPTPTLSKSTPPPSQASRAASEPPIPGARATATDSQVTGDAAEARRTDSEAAHLQAPGVDPVARGVETAANRFRSHLYSERDADVYAVLDETATSTSTSTSVKAVHAELGDHVKTGQLLATLDDAKPGFAAEAAQARAAELRAKAARTHKLLEKGYVSPADDETLRHAVAEAEANLKDAQLDLSRTRIRAPFAGVVARRHVRVGSRVDETTPLFRVTAMAPLRARLLVPEARALAVRRGMPVSVTGVGGREVVAKVMLVSPTVDPGSGTREVVVELSETGGFVPGAEVFAQLGDAQP